MKNVFCALTVVFALIGLAAINMMVTDEFNYKTIEGVRVILIAMVYILMCGAGAMCAATNSVSRFLLAITWLVIGINAFTGTDAMMQSTIISGIILTIFLTIRIAK